MHRLLRYACRSTDNCFHKLRQLDLVTFCTHPLNNLVISSWTNDESLSNLAHVPDQPCQSLHFTVHCVCTAENVSQFSWRPPSFRNYMDTWEVEYMRGQNLFCCEDTWVDTSSWLCSVPGYLECRSLSSLFLLTLSASQAVFLCSKLYW